MRPLLIAACLPAGCATLTAEPDGLVDHPVYTAHGSSGWRIEIGDDIALRLGHHFFDDDTVYAIYRYPARPPQIRDGVRRWRSRRVRSWILIEALPQPCRGGNGSLYGDTVRVIAQGYELDGCGGRLLQRGG